MTSNSSKKSRDEVASAYKSPPWWYDVRGFFILIFAYNSTLSNQIKFFSSNFGELHLEVACGTGTLLEIILKWRRIKGLPKVRITGIDYAESMLAGALSRFKNVDNIELVHADAAKMPLPSDHFDSINIANSIHCLPDIDGAIADMHRVLKPSGLLAANVLLFPNTNTALGSIAERINKWGIRKGILYTPYHRDDVKAKFEKAGFSIKHESIHGNCLNLIATKKP